MSRRLLAGVVVCAALAVAPALGQQPERKRIDTSYIASDSVLAVVINPAVVLDRKGEKPEFLTMMLENMKEESGIDPANVEQILFQLGSKSEKEEERFFDPGDRIAITLRFEKPIGNRDEIVRKLGEEATESKHAGMTFYRSSGGHRPSICFLDDSTLLMAEEPRLKQIMSVKETMSPLVTRLREADGGNDVVLEMTIAEDREMFALMFKDAPAAGEFSAGKFVEQVNALSLRAKVMSDTPLIVDLDATDAETAGKVSTQVKALIAFSKTSVDAAVRGIDGADGPEIKSVQSYMKAIKKMLDAAEVTSRENRVSVRVNVKGGVPELLDAIMLGGFGIGGSAPRAEFDGAEIEDKPAPPEPKRDR